MREDLQKRLKPSWQLTTDKSDMFGRMSYTRRLLVSIMSLCWQAVVCCETPGVTYRVPLANSRLKNIESQSNSAYHASRQAYRVLVMFNCVPAENNDL
jgi:hypothetical protein